MDTERFVRWVDEGLVQTGVIGNYVRGEKNFVVCLDNVHQHHDPRIRNLIENAGGILIFLPRYRWHQHERVCLARVFVSAGVCALTKTSAPQRKA